METKSSDKYHKDRVQRTLNFLQENGFQKTIGALNGHPYFYKKIYKDIYILIIYINSKSKAWFSHCFDLFLSNSKNIKELEKEKGISDFWIPSFDVDSKLHLDILIDILNYPNEMLPLNQFKLLNEKYLNMYHQNDLR